jgi:hypothetical protein
MAANADELVPMHQSQVRWKAREFEIEGLVAFCRAL